MPRVAVRVAVSPREEETIMSDTGTTIACDWWEPARVRALAELDRREKDLQEFTGWAACLSPGGWADAVRSVQISRDELERPDWLPERPKRSMPSLWKIAEYWLARSVFEVDPVQPHCFACRTEVPYAGDTSKKRWNSACRWLQRAHLVARVFDGLDGPQNIAALCDLCHRFQPDDDGARAIAWIQRGGWRQLDLEDA